MPLQSRLGFSTTAQITRERGSSTFHDHENSTYISELAWFFLTDIITDIDLRALQLTSSAELLSYLHRLIKIATLLIIFFIYIRH